LQYRTPIVGFEIRKTRFIIKISCSDVPKSIEDSLIFDKQLQRSFWNQKGAFGSVALVVNRGLADYKSAVSHIRDALRNIPDSPRSKRTFGSGAWVVNRGLADYKSALSPIRDALRNIPDSLLGK
jgi:hypothetical protein